MKTTIEQQFGAAMRFLNEICKRGFQAEIARRTGVDPSNLNSIIQADKGTSEQVRRDIAEAALEIAAEEGLVTSPPMPYEIFLDIGKNILGGMDGEEAKERALILVESWRNPDAPPMIWAEDIGTLGMGVRQPPTALPQSSEPAPPAQAADYESVRKAYVKLAAGSGELVYEDGASGEYHFRREWLTRKCNPKDAVLFDVEGESMEPGIAGGGVVLVDTSDREFRDDTVFAIRMGNYARVKRLHHVKDDVIKIISDNARLKPDGSREFPDEEVREDELYIIGRVFWYAREL